MRPTITRDPQADWDTIAPNLEEAVARLRFPDQQAILLRFYEQLSFAEVAKTLGITEEAARKRVSRATEKLRGVLQPVGAGLPATSLSSILLLEVAPPAPATVLAHLSTNGWAAASTAANGAKGWVAIMAYAKTKASVAVAIVLVLLTAAGVGITARRKSPSAPGAVSPLAATPPTTAAAPVGAEMEEVGALRRTLADGVSASLAALSDIELVILREYSADPEWLRSQPRPMANSGPSSSTVVRVTLKEGRARIDGPGISTEALKTKFKISDRDRILEFLATGEGSGDQPGVVGRATLMKQQRPIEHMDHETGVAALFGFSVGTMPSDVLSSREAVIDPVSMEMNGLKSYTASAVLKGMRVTYWLSAERSSLPVRLELLRLADNKAIRVCEWTEYRQLPSGEWFPQRVVEKQFGAGADQLKNVITLTWSLKELRQAPVLEASIFDTDPKSLPRGTKLDDRIAESGYTIE